MTEEAPASRPRPYRNKFYQTIFVIVGLQSLYFTFRSDTTALNEWPADLTDRSAYCQLENFHGCHDGDWFGIWKSRIANNGILKEICKSWSDKPNAANTRMIASADGDTLYLCRMKDPARIDSAKAHP